MNKPPQPLTGPTAVPNPSPSPGLTQAAYGPGQPPSLVFAPQQPPQMTSAQQPRQFATGPRTLHQQTYYQNRPAMAASAPRVQSSSGPRPAGPLPVYPASSQMMMIPQQQISFGGSQSYFIPPGQYRAPYMTPTQQYPVTSNTGYYPGTSPAEYPGFGKFFFFFVINVLHQEIMQGGRSTTTPTPPQVRHEEKAVMSLPASAAVPSPSATEAIEEVVQEVDRKTPQHTDITAQPVAAPATEELSTLQDFQQAAPSLAPEATAMADVPEAVEEGSDKPSDTVDSPVVPQQQPSAGQEIPVEAEEPRAASPEKKPEKEEEKENVKNSEKDEQVSSTKAAAAVEVPVPPADQEPTQVEAEAAPLSNGLPQETEELFEKTPVSDTTSPDETNTSPSQESTPAVKSAAPAQAEEDNKEEQKKKVDDTPASVSCPEESTMQTATSVPKKKKNMKELNKKEAIGDLLDAFTEEQRAKPVPEPSHTQANPPAPAEPPAEAVDETWEEKEDKQNADPEKEKSQLEPSDQKYQYKEENWKPIDPEEKKRYDREFLLRFQFSNASMHKPEGLPVISDVVLDKVNKTPLRPPDPARLANAGPDFTPSFMGNLGSRSMGGPRGPPPGPRRSQQGQRKEPRKIISSLGEDIQLNKAEKAWKPSVKKPNARAAEEVDDDDPENAKTRELFKRLRSILNKLTPQKFQELMKQVSELAIDTEERLKGAIDLIFEKAISEPNFSVAYANMCRCLMGLKVPTPDKPGNFVNFRKLLLNRCQKEFEKDQDDDEIFERKQKELDASKDDEERERLRVELEEAKDKARRRSLGNIKFIGELFKLKMLTEAIMHDCVVKLLKNHDEESLECLCRLLSTIGKDLDFEKAKPRMDQYFTQMDKIIKEKKTSSRIRFMLQDVLDLRRNNWVPRRGDLGPKTIDQIHKEAEMEEHREQIKVQQQLMSRKEPGGRMGGNMGGRGSHSSGGGRVSQPQDEGWNTVPISKNRPIDTTRLSKITKTGTMDLNNQLLAPGGKGMWSSWGKGSSGGSGAKPASGEQDSGRPATSTLNRFSALQQSGSLMASTETDRRVPQRSSSSRERGGDRDRSERDRDRFDRFARSEEQGGDQFTKRSFSRESKDRGSRGGDSRASNEPVRRVASMTDDRDRGSRDRGSRDRGTVRRESAPTPPPSLPKPALTEEQVEKKANAIIEEYLHINDVKEALQCVAELNSASLLYVFVRNCVESTLERSTIAREHMGLLLHNLVKAGTLPTQQYFKGLEEILEAAEDMAIDIPHIWLYLAELITPMLHEGGIPMGQLFREISKPLVPLGKAGVLLAQILQLLCKGMVRTSRRGVTARQRHHFHMHACFGVYRNTWNVL
uniref:Eukaryotic translation initiation factor 4 gamma, 1a n=1 Tax=Oryzias sinensis TaxID=183150 RepID=A0A8C7ZVD7_9TELE